MIAYQNTGMAIMGVNILAKILRNGQIKINLRFDH